MTNEQNNAVSVKNLEKKFGTFTAVNRVNFEVSKGEIFGFLGPNGAGKSTTIRMLCGIITPTSGEGQVGGFDIIKEQERIKQNIGYMSQKFSLYEDLTVEENIDFYSGIYKIPRNSKKERKEWIIKMAGIEKFRFNLTKDLSGGWKQRLALGCAIIHEPKIIFLDEPTSGVDPIARQDFWNLIKEMAKKGVTIFVTTHYMDEAENCNRMALVYRGTIIALGTSGELKNTFMKDNVLNIEIDCAEEWIEKLMKISTIKETALFGNAIHAIAEDEKKSIADVKNLFEKEKVKNYKVEKIEPSLEDVFVSLIESYDKTKDSRESEKS